MQEGRGQGTQLRGRTWLPVCMEHRGPLCFLLRPGLVKRHGLGEFLVASKKSFSFYKQGNHGPQRDHQQCVWGNERVGGARPMSL